MMGTPASDSRVFVLPGRKIAPLIAGLTLRQRGTTAHFTVRYDDSLGSNGPVLADAVLSTCERDYGRIRAYFGGITPANLPFIINIASGTSGAGHNSCAATAIRCDAFQGTNNDLTRMLVMAEVAEVFMAQQDAGWNCAASNGEGLSRIIATELYPAQLGDFATASDWLNSSRPDWVSRNDSSAGTYDGYNPASIGCSTLFINYLHYQLGYSFDAIVQAGGDTLSQTYLRLSGSNDAFEPFARLLESYYPAGTPVSLDGDNPFPLHPDDFSYLSVLLLRPRGCSSAADLSYMTPLLLA